MSYSDRLRKFLKFKWLINVKSQTSKPITFAMVTRKMVVTLQELQENVGRKLIKLQKREN